MHLSVTLIPASGIYCSYISDFWGPTLWSVSLFVFCISRSVAKFNLFLDNLLHLPSKTDKWKIGNSLSEFKDKIVSSALAAQDSLTENLIVIWIANQVHNIDCVRQHQQTIPKLTVMQARSLKYLKQNCQTMKFFILLTKWTTQSKIL